MFESQLVRQVGRNSLPCQIWESRSRYSKLSRYQSPDESLNVSVTVRTVNRKTSMKAPEYVQMVKLDRTLKGLRNCQNGGV